MEGKSGCAVFGVVLALVVIIAAALLVGKLAEYNDAEASRLYARGSLEESYGRAQAEIARAQADARAAIITAESQARLNQAIAEAQMVLAQGQARLDSAQAFAVTAGASLPWLVVSLVGVAGIVLLAAIVAMLTLGLAALRGSHAGPALLDPARRVLVLNQPARLAAPEPTAQMALPVLHEPAGGRQQGCYGIRNISG
jgi:hypothetical protein